MKETPIPAGPELDALIATRVFNFYQANWHDEERWFGVGPHCPQVHASCLLNLPGSSVQAGGLPKFSTDMTAAWAVRAEMRRRGWELILHQSDRENSSVLFRDADFDREPGWSKQFDASGPFGEEAALICRAALLALSPPVVE